MQSCSRGQQSTWWVPCMEGLCIRGQHTTWQGGRMSRFQTSLSSFASDPSFPPSCSRPWPTSPRPRWTSSSCPCPSGPSVNRRFSGSSRRGKASTRTRRRCRWRGGGGGGSYKGRQGCQGGQKPTACLNQRTEEALLPSKYPFAILLSDLMSLFLKCPSVRLIAGG